MERPYEHLAASIPDHPKLGVTFKDVTPIFGDPVAFRAVVDDLAERFRGRGVTKVMGAEARGFVVGAPVAYVLGAGFVPARKPGKLPRATVSAAYDLEYGSDALEVHADALAPSDVVLVVDDLVASGGTAVAMAELAKACGARVAGFGFLMELGSLAPRDRIAQASDAEVFSLIVA